MAHPKGVVNYRGISVNGFIDIVGAIHIGITHYLDLDAVVAVALHFNRGYVLEDIAFKHGLDQDKVRTAFHRFHNTQIINLVVEVQVKVLYFFLWIVQHPLKFLQVFGITK